MGPEGAVSTVNAEPLVAVPLAFCTLIVPVVAPAGTVVTICVLLDEVAIAVTPLNFTVF